MSSSSSSSPSLSTASASQQQALDTDAGYEILSADIFDEFRSEFEKQNSALDEIFDDWSAQGSNDSTEDSFERDLEDALAALVDVIDQETRGEDNDGDNIDGSSVKGEPIRNKSVTDKSEGKPISGKNGTQRVSKIIPSVSAKDGMAYPSPGKLAKKAPAPVATKKRSSPEIDSKGSTATPKAPELPKVSKTAHVSKVSKVTKEADTSKAVRSKSMHTESKTSMLKKEIDGGTNKKVLAAYKEQSTGENVVSMGTFFKQNRRALMLALSLLFAQLALQVLRMQKA